MTHLELLEILTQKEREYLNLTKKNPDYHELINLCENIITDLKKIDNDLPFDREIIKTSIEFYEFTITNLIISYEMI